MKHKWMSKSSPDFNPIHSSLFESLEQRSLFSVATITVPLKIVTPLQSSTPTTPVVTVPAANAPLTISQSGGVLSVMGTPGSDKISIKQSGSVLTVKNGSWSNKVQGTFTQIVVQGNGGNDSISIDPSVTVNADLYGGAGNDTIVSGSGNDEIYAGGGVNTIVCGSGNDTVVTVGATADSITGGNGFDSFWINASNDTLTGTTDKEIAAGHIHRIASFLNGVSTSLNGQTFAEPAVTSPQISYQNFDTVPLFTSTGPSEDDIMQGGIGDCWYLSSLASVAKANPDRIRQTIVALGDGTYAVQFNRSGQTVFARVDGNLPTMYNQPVYARVVNTHGQSTKWVALMEKAMTEFMGTPATYTDINGNWMGTAYNSMGLSNQNIFAQSATDLANQLAAATAAKAAVTLSIGTPAKGAPLIGDHAYTVDHVTTDADGNVLSITLRNPWGFAGAGNNGNNDGYVTITPQQAFASYSGACAANA